MRVVFVSNYFNHHQKPICDELYRILDKDFIFISTEYMSEERVKLGYSQSELPTYVLSICDDSQKKYVAIDMINAADVVIIGSAPEELVSQRVHDKKLIFRYTERPFKKKASVLRKMYHAIRFRIRDYGNKNVFILCASSYAYDDFYSIGLYQNRMFRWGYFPLEIENDVDDLISRKDPNLLVWCGRFIDWKHPDDAIMIAHRLKNKGYTFHLNMIGTGIMEDELHQLVKKYGLTDYIHFLGAMPPEKVRKEMEKAGIYLFTSDRQEGWGAVINESMNSCCAVVANQDIGSVPFLINDGDNGYTYPSGNLDKLSEKVELLLDSPKEQKRIGRHAYHTIHETWNASIAAERIVHLSQNLLEERNNLNLYMVGPCSIISK